MPTIKDYRERQVYIDKANQVESQYGIPHNLLVGLLKTESGFNKDVISGKRKSSAGATGIAQFMPATAKEFGIDPRDPIASIEAAGKYLSNNYKKLGNWDDTLRSYNLGLGGVNKWKAGKRKLPKETEEYVGKVYKNGKINIGISPTQTSQTPVSDAAIAQANTYFSEQTTTDVKDLQNTEEIVNFEAEPDEIVAEKEETQDKDIQEVQKQTAEYNFLEEYKALVNQQQPEAVVQEEIQQPQIPQQNLTDIYNQVSEFVDAPVAQQGGAISSVFGHTGLLNILPTDLIENKTDQRKLSDVVKIKSSLNEGETNYVRTTKPSDKPVNRVNPLEREAATEFNAWYSDPATQQRFSKNTGLDPARLQDFVGKGLRTPTRAAESNEDIGYLSQIGADALYTTPYYQQMNQRTSNDKTGEILYQKQRESSSLSKAPNMKNVLQHEFAHASNLDAVLAPALNRVLGDVNNQTKGTFKRDREYLSHPEETYGNFHMFRKNLGLKPGQKIDEKQLQQLVKEKGLDEEIFYKAYDDDKIVKAINTIAQNNNKEEVFYSQQGTLVDNLKRDFGNKPKQMYLPEGSAEYKKYKEQDRYYNPVKKEGITTGDWKQDLIYENDWLLDTPIVGTYIKEEAKKVAKASEGQPFMSPKEAEAARETDLTRKEYKAGDRKGATLLDQYFSDKPLYPTAKYQPNSNYLEFLPTYSLKESFEKNPAKQKVFNQEIMNFMFQGDEKGYSEFLKTKKPVYRRAKDGSEVADLLEVDLGGHKTGAAWDEEVNLPYVSISDAWDFEPKAYAKKWDESSLSDKDADTKTNEERSFIQSYLMHKSGQPFKIYDRFYFDPKTRKYIPDTEIDKLRPKKQQGGIPISSEGVYEYPGQNVVVPTKDGKITMQNVNYPILGIDELGTKQMMYPNQEYKFEGKIITEIPQLTKNEKEFLKYIIKISE